VVGLVVGVGGYFYLDYYRFGQIPRIAVTSLDTAPAANEPYDVLLVSESGQGHSSTAASGAATFVFVARMIPRHHRAALLAIPSELYVPVAGGGSAPISSAASDGPSVLASTIETDFHLPIQHVIELDTAGYAGMVNALGGIDLDFPDPERDASSGLDITSTGCQVIDGSEALSLVESRHLYYYTDGSWKFDPDATTSGIRRQHIILQAIADRADSETANVFAVNDLLGVAARSVKIDQRFNLGSLDQVLRLLSGSSTATPVTYVLPSESGPSVTLGGAEQSVLLPIPSLDRALVTHFLGLASSRPAESVVPRTSSSTSATLSTPSPSSLDVRVLNGNGVADLAAEVETELHSFGYRVSGNANAASFNYAESEILYAPSDLPGAALLAHSIGGGATLSATPGLGAHALTLILGKSFTTISAPPASLTSPGPRLSLAAVLRGEPPATFEPTPCDS
jgi:LCP family protein required for cell wall assembly